MGLPHIHTPQVPLVQPQVYQDKPQVSMAVRGRLPWPLLEVGTTGDMPSLSPYFGILPLGKGKSNTQCQSGLTHPTYRNLWLPSSHFREQAPLWREAGLGPPGNGKTTGLGVKRGDCRAQSSAPRDPG